MDPSTLQVIRLGLSNKQDLGQRQPRAPQTQAKIALAITLANISDSVNGRYLPPTFSAAPSVSLSVSCTPSLGSSASVLCDPSSLEDSPTRLQSNCLEVAPSRVVDKPMTRRFDFSYWNVVALSAAYGGLSAHAKVSLACSAASSADRLEFSNSGRK